MKKEEVNFQSNAFVKQGHEVNFQSNAFVKQGHERFLFLYEDIR
jgi:hypothetical protein